MIQFTRTKHYPQMSLEDAVGLLPFCWDTSDPRTAVEQHDERQVGNGPFSDFKGFTYDTETEALKYPGDPALLPLAFAVLPLSRERIIVYPHAWVAIVQDDGSYRVDRRD